MKQVLLVLLVLSGLWSAEGCRRAAEARGGAWRGPAGEVPPSHREPWDPYPPDPPTGPPNAPIPPRVSRPGILACIPARFRMTFDHWLFWWGYNQDALASSPGASRPATPEIRLALQRVVESEAAPDDLRGAAVIALSRCREADTTSTLLRIANPQTGESAHVRESAILALGLAGKKGDAVIAQLVRIADDATLDARCRSFAMVSLGLLGAAEPSARECLLRRLDGRETQADVRLTAFLALGLFGDETVRPAVENVLKRGRIGSTKATPVERAWAIDALGRIGDPAALSTVSAHLGSRDPLVARSAMISMGRLVPCAPPADRLKYAVRLRRAVEEQRDVGARNFGVIALGRIGSSPDAGACLQKACRDWVRRRFQRVETAAERPFAALSLGLLGREDAPANDGLRGHRRQLAPDLLRQEFEDGRPPSGTVAIALGLLGDSRPATLDLLIRTFTDRGQSREARGSAATALGILGGERAGASIRTVLLDAEEAPDVRRSAASAAGLLGDASTAGALCDLLLHPKTNAALKTAAAQALGRIGDPDSVDRLLAILEPEKAVGVHPSRTRALAAVVLGRIADTGEVRTLSRISEDLNYRASFDALDELMSIL